MHAWDLHLGRLDQDNEFQISELPMVEVDTIVKVKMSNFQGSYRYYQIQAEPRKLIV